MTAGAEREKENNSGRTQPHWCSYCDASFTRLEHLKRHQTMHTKGEEAEADTLLCATLADHGSIPKNLEPLMLIDRSDVLRRHYQSCKLAQQADSAPIAMSRRVNRACIACRQSKVRCSGLQPCERCSSMGNGHLCCFTLRKLRLAGGGEANSPRNNMAAPEPDEPPAVNGGNTQHDRSNGMETAPGTLIDPSTSALDYQAEVQASEAQALVPARYEWTSESHSMVEMISDQASMGASQPHPLVGPSIPNAANNTTNPTEFELSPGMFIDLDLLDYGILDNSVMMLDDNPQTASATTVSVDETWDSLGNTLPDQGEQQGDIAHHLPKGIRLMQISPLDAHRTQTLRYLQESSLNHRRWDRWLSSENMNRYLSSYFRFFHRHTPLLHLPSWNISTTSTRLLFSMVLMGAIYSGDLNLKSSTDRQLCQLAQTFAWSRDASLQANTPAQLDTIQAVYIATLAEAFYFPPKRHGPPVDIKRLTTEARKSGVFRSNRSLSEPWKMKWGEWSFQESRKRTAFILYLFDAIQAIFFEQRPEIQLHELRLPLPCDESIYSAETEEEWSGLYLHAQDLTKIEYPVLLALFLCHQPLGTALNFSVMGAFIVLHGILLHVWEQQSIHRRDSPGEIPDEAEQSVREHLAAAQAQVADNALQLWLKQWNQTLSRPASMESQGLYRDRALVYWFLGNVMNQHSGSADPENPAALVNGQWRMRIPGILRRLAVLVDSGQLDSSNGAVISGIREKLASYLGDLNEGADTDTCGEGMDAITLSYIMRKDRK